MKRDVIKLCVATGTRADYGLLSNLLRLAKADESFQLIVMATGTHLSRKFGMTVKEIESDGFQVDYRIKLPLSSDTPYGTAKAAAAALTGFAKAFERAKPDVLLVLGDRFEMFSAVEAALFAGIPVGHISGGERTDGAYDDALRHSMTKMSQLHFTAADEYAKRVLQLGEDPKHVFNVGAMAVDSIASAKLLSKKELETWLGRPLAKHNLLVTFHPATAEGSQAHLQFKELLKSLDKLKDTLCLFTMPNADTGGRKLFALVDGYVKANPEKALAFVSMGRIRYLSAMKYAEAVVGNSSSGIVETPSFKIGTINIGTRQGGRLRAASVIDCEPTERSIDQAFRKLHSPEFQALLRTVKSPFGTPGSSRRILELLKKVDLRNLPMKCFRDQEFAKRPVAP